MKSFSLKYSIFFGSFCSSPSAPSFSSSCFSSSFPSSSGSSSGTYSSSSLSGSFSPSAPSSSFFSPSWFSASSYCSASPSSFLYLGGVFPHVMIELTITRIFSLSYLRALRPLITYSTSLKSAPSKL